MKKLSLVDPSRLRDPRGLLFKFPSMPAIKYKYISDRFYRNYTLDVAEKIAAMFGCYLVPAACVHHRRKNPERRIMIHGHSYYVRHPDEMNEIEYEKFLQFVGGMDIESDSLTDGQGHSVQS